MRAKERERKRQTDGTEKKEKNKQSHMYGGRDVMKTGRSDQ